MFKEEMADKIGELISELEELRQAIETFIIAAATQTSEEKAKAYREMLKIARLEEYL